LIPDLDLDILKFYLHTTDKVSFKNESLNRTQRDLLVLLMAR